MRVWPFLLALTIPALLGCGGDDSGEDTLPNTDAGSADGPSSCEVLAPYAQTGPYVSGVTTIDREGVPVEVWYPADPGAEAGRTKDRYDMREWLPEDVANRIAQEDVPWHETNAFRDISASASGPFPIVLFSHGLGGYRSQSSFLTVHLASWGFVVVAPEHPERGLAAVLRGDSLADNSSTALLDAMDMLGGENTSAGGRFEGKLDFERIAVSGHSMGGGATMVVATDPRVDTWFTLASPAPGKAPGKSFLMMAGEMDNIAVIDEVREGYEKKEERKRFAAVSRAGHLAFTDICTLAEDQGGLFEVAKKYGVQVDDLLVTLGSDGCGPDNLPAEEGWQVINHYVTAHLRAELGIDAAPKGLDSAAKACFGGRVHEFTQE